MFTFFPNEGLSFCVSGGGRGGGGGAGWGLALAVAVEAIHHEPNMLLVKKEHLAAFSIKQILVHPPTSTALAGKQQNTTCNMIDGVKFGPNMKYF